MNRYLRLFRLGNGIMGILGVIIGAFIAVGFNIGDYLFNLIVASFIVVTFMAGGNSLNDYIDREIDKTAHPNRPLPMGEIAPETALKLGIICLAASIAISLLLGSIITTCIVLVAALLMVAYERFLKQQGFIGNLTIAIMTGMIFLFGGVVVDHMEANIIIAVMAVLVSIGREIAKDVEDMDSDEGRRTLPMIIGVRNACILAALFFVAGPILSIVPLISDTFGALYCLVFAADAIFIYCAWVIFRNAHSSQKMAKIAMMIALIAFILGVIQ